VNTFEEVLERKVADYTIPLYSQKVGANFAEKRWWLGWYSSPVD
jgi:hypothetical protein